MEKTQISVEKTQILRRWQKNLDLVKKPRSGHTGCSRCWFIPCCHD